MAKWIQATPPRANSNANWNQADESRVARRAPIRASGPAPARGAPPARKRAQTLFNDLASFSPLKNTKFPLKKLLHSPNTPLHQTLVMAKKSARKPNAAFMKPVQPDDVLAAVVGAKPLPRTELTKKLWDYIKKNGLQDKKVKTNINADDKLKAIFNGKKVVSMFEMTKLVSAHLKK